MPASSFIERVKNQMTVPDTSWLGRKRLPRKENRHPIVVNRWDLEEWRGRRTTVQIDSLIEDLVAGDPSSDRPPFEDAAPLVEGTFFLFYKADPQLTGKRELARELYPVHRILQEVKMHPGLEDVREHTFTEAEMSVLATEAMGDVLREILSRLPEPPPPPMGGGSGAGQQGQGQGSGGGQPSPGGGGGGGDGQGGDQDESEGQGQGQEGDDQNQDQGQGEGQGSGGDQENEQEGPGSGPGSQDGDGDGEDEAEGQGGQGDQEGEDGPPPPPEEREAEKGDQPDDLIQGEDEFDPDLNDAEESDWEAQYDAALDGLDLDRLVGRGLEATLKDTAELEGLRKDIGVDDGVWATMDPSQRLALAEALRTPEMMALASMIGRMTRFALGVKATRIIDVPHEAYDVTLGNDIKHVLPSEFVYLANEWTEWEFYRRYVTRELLQFKLRGKEEAGKGPIVCMVDKSTSMNGDPFRWAIAVAEALRRFAMAEDRDMYIMLFGTNNDRTRFWFPKGQGPIEKVLTLLGAIANGGTDFDGVLGEGIERAVGQFDGEGKDRADLVFITDGHANLSDAWIRGFNEERERAGVKMYSVYIGGADDMLHRTAPVKLLDRISDAVISVDELEPQAVRDIFAHV